MSQKHFHVLELWRVGYRALFHEMGNKPTVVMVSTGLSSIVEKTSYIQEKLGYKVVWVSRLIQGFRHLRDRGVMAGCLTTVVRALRMRRTVDNVVAVMVHAAVTHTAVEKLKRMVPGVKVISCVYDWMNLFCPPEKRKLWLQYVDPDQLERCEQEYAALEQITRGELVEGITYKDYGPDFPFLKDCKAKKVWIPPALQRSLYQKPPPIDVPRCALYVGTIVPKMTHQRSAALFGDIFMERIFREVSEQDWRIHAYVLNPHQDVEDEYRRLFPDGKVKLFRGDLLRQLLPRVAGRYRFGWMLYRYPSEIIMEHVKVSIPTKLFTYMALGLPVLVSEEMEAVAKMVREHRIGVIFSQDEILDVNKKIDEYDYGTMVNNVMAVREDYSLEVFSDRLGALVKDVLAGPTIYVEDQHDKEKEPEKKAFY